MKKVRHYKRRQRTHEQVELNMAAMLDMAFQLLAFFILTFQPSEVETQISMRMPREKAVTTGASAEVDPNPPTEEEDFGLPLQITIYSNQDGAVDRLKVGPNLLQSDSAQSLYATLDSQVAKMITELGIDRIQISVEDALSYESLMYVVDVCAKQKLPTGEQMSKISISLLK